MSIIELVSWSFGLYEREAEYIDKLMDKDFSFLDIESTEIAEYIDRVGSSDGIKNLGVCNFIIENLFEKIVEYGIERGLDRDCFSIEINSVCSEIKYNGVKVSNQDDLEEMIRDRKVFLNFANSVSNE